MSKNGISENNLNLAGFSQIFSKTSLTRDIIMPGVIKNEKKHISKNWRK